MPDIRINDRLDIKGELTFSIEKNEEAGRFEIMGQLITHGYYELITKLETNRYVLEKVDVYKEIYDADDYNITYLFTAKSRFIKGGISNLDINTITEIEQDIYKEDYDEIIKRKSGEKTNG